MADAVERLWAVVPAGGAGTRLWPLSRAASPKFLHDLTGTGRTLLQATVDRLLPLVGERILVVSGAAHQTAVRRQLSDLAPAQVIAEPAPRDSMAAIGLAAATIERADPTGIIGSFAADHVIRDEDAFRAVVREASEVADTGLLVTIGIEPTGPVTGYGYVRAGEPLAGFPTARTVVEFVEKPPAERAQAYVASGDYRWNAGMFVSRATVLMDLLAEHRPQLAAGLRAIATTRRRSRTGGPCWRRSRSTMRLPSRPQRPVGWRPCPGASAGTTSETSARSPRCCRTRPTACRCWAIRRRWWCRTAPGSSYRPATAWSPCSGSRTWSSSTQATRSWSRPPTVPRT